MLTHTFRIRHIHKSLRISGNREGNCFFQLLKVLQFKDEVQITATSKGLKITAEVSKSFFGSAFIQKETFSEYQINRPTQAEGHDDSNEDDYEMEFNISLFTLVQCLNVTGTVGTGGSSTGGTATSAMISKCHHAP